MLEAYLPFWKQLTLEQQEKLRHAVSKRRANKGEVLHNGAEDCVGLMIVIRGQLRTYILSEEGREITLYRLFERDMCLFSASCMLHSIQFEVSVEAAQDTEFYHIPVDTYQKLMKESAAVANYTNEIMATRFSDVMWLMDQILYKRMDVRVAGFLLEESRMEGRLELKITHEAIAHHLGTAREVVTRMLKYLQEEGMITLSRGSIRLTAPEQMEIFAADSLR